LLIGLYDGETTFTDLLRHGDFGLGTVDQLDGELIVLDGVAYHVTADGAVHQLPGEQTTPFAAVTFFEPDLSGALPAGMSLPELQQALDLLLPSPNIFYAIKITGTFAYVKTRSVPKQENKPYPILSEIVKTQPEFEFNSIQGTLVALRAPQFVEGINVPGYHFHFLTHDLRGGGHVLELETLSGQVEIDLTHQFEMLLPNSQDFYEADLRSDDLDEVENPKSTLRLYSTIK
jgi:acetolactate decarboxylase